MEIIDMIDATSFARVLYHVVTDREMKDMIEVKGDKEKLAEVGKWFTEGTEDHVASVIKGMKDGTIILKPEKRPSDRMVYVLRIPPYYLFIDTGKTYE